MKIENTKGKNNSENIKEDNKNQIKEELKEDKIEKQNEENISLNEKKSKSKLRKILGIITNAILIATIILVIVIAIRALVFKKSDVFGYGLYIIMSGSMESTISTGDVVITKKYNKDLQKGDIIAFQTSNVVTVHRIVEIYEENGKKLYETKGDNNNTVDAKKITISEVKGEVVCTIPKIGNIILFLKSHLIILVYIVAFIIIVYLIRRLM